MNTKLGIPVIIAVASIVVAVLASIVALTLFTDSENTDELVVTIIGFAVTITTAMLALLSSQRAEAGTAANHESLRETKAKIDTVQEVVNGKLTEAIEAQKKLARTQGQLQAATEASAQARDVAASAATAAIEKARQEIKAAEAKAYEEAYQKGLADGAKGRNVPNGTSTTAGAAPRTVTARVGKRTVPTTDGLAEAEAADPDHTKKDV